MSRRRPGTATIPTGPNTSNGDGGVGTIDVSPSASTATATSGSTNLGFTEPAERHHLNADAPNRVYVERRDGLLLPVQ